MDPTEFYHNIRTISGQRRENLIWSALSTNIPAWVTAFKPVTTTAKDATGKTRTFTMKVSTDYLGVGDDTGYFRLPMWPGTAQRIADLLGCHLPTRRIVNRIYQDPTNVKLPPEPIRQEYFKREKFSMTSSRAFWEHNKMVDQHLPPTRDKTFAGHKKDIVITPHCVSGHVAIYGWFDHGNVIQDLNCTSHSAWYVDYSHGVRLVQDIVTVDGVNMSLGTALAHPAYHVLFSDEGVLDLAKLRYGSP